MANSKMRQIDTKLWQRRWFQNLSHEGKYLYLYLLTNPHSNLSGVYEIMDRQVIFDTGLENVERVFNEMAEKGEVYRFQDFVIIARFPDNHNWQTSWPIGKAYINELKDLPPNLLNYIKKTKYVEHYKPLSDVYSFQQEMERVNNQFLMAREKKQPIDDEKTQSDSDGSEKPKYQNKGGKPEKFVEFVPF
jgi:hypothetical protein